jgi:ferredoxin
MGALRIFPEGMPCQALAELVCLKEVPKIEINGSVYGKSKTLDVDAGGELLDLCDEYFAPIPFSCRSASCGTCHVDVVEGAEHLEPASPEEQDLLEVLRGPRTARLACQARVKAGPGLIRLRSLLL